MPVEGSSYLVLCPDGIPPVPPCLGGSKSESPLGKCGSKGASDAEEGLSTKRPEEMAYFRKTMTH